MRYIIGTSLLLMGIIFVPKIVICENGSNSEAVRQTVEKFCLAEFEGDVLERREEFVKLSPNEVRMRKKARPEMQPLAYDKMWDLLYVVTSYTVLASSVTVMGNKATAFVEYRRVGTRKKEGYKVESYKDERDVVKLNLVCERNHWFVLDPPLPRVSRNVMIRTFEQDLAATSARWFKVASAVQRAERQKEIDALRMLKDNISE